MRGNPGAQGPLVGLSIVADFVPSSITTFLFVRERSPLGELSALIASTLPQFAQRKFETARMKTGNSRKWLRACLHCHEGAKRKA